MTVSGWVFQSVIVKMRIFELCHTSVVKKIFVGRLLSTIGHDLFACPGSASVELCWINTRGELFETGRFSEVHELLVSL